MFLKQGDLAPILTIAFKNGTTPVDLTGATCVAKIRRRHQTTVLSKTLTVSSPTTGIGTYQWVAGDTDTVGTYEVEGLATFPGSIPQRFPQRSDLELHILPKVG